MPAWGWVTADRKGAEASISARFAGPAAGLMIRACGTGAKLSCDPGPQLQRFRSVRQVGIEADQQGRAAVGAPPLGAVTAQGIRTAPGRVIPLDEPVPAAVGAVPGDLHRQTSSPRCSARCWHAIPPVPWG